MGPATSNFLAPLLGPGEGSKGQKSFNFNYKVDFKDFYTKMNDTKHIRQDFHSVPWVMPQGCDFGALGLPRESKKIFSNMVM